MSQYDPFGRLSPILLRAKLLLRSLYEKGVQMTWDQPLTAAQNKGWINFLEDAGKMKPIIVPRSLHPKDGKVADVVAFWDGSMLALGTCMYVRWELAEGGVFTGQLAAKCRVAPVAGATIQRMELQGLLACSRMVLQVVTALPFSVRRVTICGDSMCCLAAV